MVRRNMKKAGTCILVMRVIDPSGVFINIPRTLVLAFGPLEPRASLAVLAFTTYWFLSKKIVEIAHPGVSK